MTPASHLGRQMGSKCRTRALKLVGGVWKFKAMGYDAAGRMEPGHGPLTDQHNMAFAAPDAAEVSARLLGALAGESGAGS